MTTNGGEPIRANLQHLYKETSAALLCKLGKKLHNARVNGFSLCLTVLSSRKAL